ncbi:MAG: hypothetical protein FWF00_01810, partial [Endomicrobia bacterium]|nr:hypothetical protein [Endomicrobiia bacterium]
DFEKLGKKFADEYEAGKISIDNDFDLKVVLAGINLEYVLKSKNSAYSGVCSRIAQAANINVGENAVDYFGCFAFRNISHNNLVYRLLEQYSIDKSLSDKDVAEYEIYKRKQLTENRPAMNKTAGYQEDIANLNNSIAKNFGLLSEDKKAELLSKELLTDREMKYFEIANKDEGELLKIIKEEAEDIRLTLFALLNAPSLIGLPKVDAIAAEFIEQFKAGKISIENDFDLQAVIAGINLAVTSNLKKENIFPALYYNKGIYNKIAKAIIVNKWPEGIEGEGKYKVKAAANSNLIFDETDYSLSLEVIAHELGHIYLNILGFTSYDAETEKTMHEFFADVVACAADSIFDSDNAWRRGYSPVKLFLNTKKKEVESHDMARKMISTVRKSFEFIDEQLGDWQIIAKTAVKFIKGGIFDKDNSQTENTKNFIELFAEAMNTEFGVDNKAIINGFKKQETLSLFKYIGFGITGVLYLAGLIFSYIQGSTNSLLLIGMLLPFSLLIFSGYLLLDNTSFINKIKQFLSGIRHARLTTKDSDNVVIEVGENDLQETADIITESAKPLTPDMLYKAEDLKLEEKIDIDFFKGSNIESGIKSFEKRLIDLGIENIPTFGLRGLPQEFYGNNRDSEYMVPINPAQFISLMNVMPNREITEIYTNSSVQDIFIEILRNTFLGLTEGFGNEIEDYANPQLKHTGTFVVYNTDNGYVSNNLNEGDVVYGYYLDNLKTLSYTAAEKGKRWYSKYMSSTDKGEKFAVMLTQSELDGIKKAADDFIRTDLQEYLRKNKYVYDHDYYLKIILPKYINKYLYAKFLENLVQVTEQSIESSKIELTDFSKPILIETDSDVFIVAMWAEESGYPHIERYVANGDRVREKDRYFPIAEFESLTGLKINIDNSNRNRIIIENTGTKNTRLTQFDNKINQSPLQGAAVISDAKISQDLKTAKNLFNGKDAEIFYLDKITGNDVEKYLERMKSGQPVVLYPYSMEINEQLSLQELHSLYMYIADKFSFLQKTLDSAAGEGISFSTIEFLKNAFIHGNKADFNRPIFIESSNDYELAVYNSVNDSKTISNIEKAFMTDVGLTGWHRGLEKISGYGLVSDSSEIEISGDKFYRAVVKNKNSVNPAQAASDLLKQTNPAAVVKETQKIAVKLVVSKDQIEKLNADEIRLEENLVLVENASKAKELQEQGFRTFVINTSEKPVKGNWNKLKTALTDESGNKIGRVYVNKNSGEIVVHSKNKISAEAAAEALSRIISEGVKEQGFEGIRQIIVSMGNAKEETFEAIVGRMKIEHTNKKVKEKALDLTSGFMQREFAEKCRGALVRDDIGVFIITQEQSKNNSGVIRMLQREGMRFVVSLTGEEFYNNGILLDGLQIHAENMAKDEVTKLLKDVEKKRLENADGIFSRITIKLSEKVLSEFSEGVFETYGIMPIIGINSTYGRQAEVEVTSESDVEKALADERVKALNLNDTSILSLVKNEEKKSAKSAYDKGYRAGLCSKFNYSLKARDSVLSLKVFLSKNIDEITEKDVKDIIGVFSEDKDILSYVNYLLAKGEAQEAAGFIRAAAMNTVREEVLDILKNREINIDKEKLLKNEIFQKPYLTLALQLKLSGADLNELFNEEYVSSSMTAAEYLNAIAKEVDMEMKNILNDNDYKVEEIKSGNKEKAAAVFKNFNVLLQDRFRTKGIPKEVKISTTLAVRSILAAA